MIAKVLRVTQVIGKRRIRPNVYIRFISTRSDERSPFLFTPNVDQHPGINGSKLQEQYSQYYRNALTFKNPNYYYRDLEFEDMDDVEINSTPAEDFGVILDRNLNSVPVPGSVVEFIHPTTLEVKFGVVIRESQARFDESLNRLVVLMPDNEVVQISPMDVNFHCHSLIYGDFETIYENIMHTDIDDRLYVISAMHKFIHDSHIMKKLFEDKLDRLFFQFATSRIRALSFAHLIDATQFPEHMIDVIKESRWNQCALFMGLHLNLVNSCRWIVPKYIPANKGSNIFNEEHSNNYVSRPIYLVNTEDNWIAISKFLDDMKTENGFHNLNHEFSSFYKHQTSKLAVEGDKLNAALSTSTHRHFAHVIEMLKFMVIYPHDTLLTEIKKLDLFKNVETASDIYNILEELKIFKHGQASDVLVESGILGEVNKSKEVHEVLGSDNFRHLRGKGFSRDLVVYGLNLNYPSNSQTPTIGVSLEKILRDEHILRIHIPDPITFHSPTSKPMRKAFHPEYGFVSGMDHLINNQHWFPLFPNKGFPSWHDKTAKNVETSNFSTCMTVSFKYNPLADDPFQDLQSLVSVRMDNILSCNIKKLDDKELEKCLAGVRIAPDVVSWLEGTSERTSNLTLNDQETIRGIYSIMQRFFKRRSIHNASPPDPLQTPSSIDSSNLSHGLVTTVKNDFSFMLEEESAEQVKKDTSVTAYKVTNHWPNTHESHFLINELRVLVGTLVSEYCIDKNIPILRRAQHLNTGDFPEDKVIVPHRTVLQKSYDATSYSYMLYSKNSKGYMTPQNVLVSKSFLAPESITFRDVEDKENIVLGLDNGWANIVDVYSKGEAVVNQLQILMSLQYTFQRAAIRRGASLIAVNEKFSNLRRLGYETNGAFPERVLAGQIENIINGDNDSKYVMQTIKKYWTLRCLQQDVRKVQEFECMITKVGVSMMPGVILSKGYCVELDIEVDVLTDVPNQYVGMPISCNQVVWMDPVGGACLLKDKKLVIDDKL
ncbi:uncharacterized protein SPAPADRAFT_49509 [Spathaspora passalidarum NRRL Y-27907]|uniref:Uncharacterized protein n=1 Tax=Spathaspora passalidarum (strain NRRL Y-27907 / 11-Y1) TaxID=619300 RepID=G3AIQ0_SPAPN|nr:uncharacterized protein SPAPADRAFT_49509 [Spathaspora passalidarum NRRL Y-27907]EGW34466.1 hypothetical protein SPAPADRAFT_49509 [Spathaspora passalidarum NRRL Y-27907]